MVTNKICLLSWDLEHWVCPEKDIELLIWDIPKSKSGLLIWDGGGIILSMYPSGIPILIFLRFAILVLFHIILCLSCPNIVAFDLDPTKRTNHLYFKFQQPKSPKNESLPVISKSIHTRGILYSPDASPWLRLPPFSFFDKGVSPELSLFFLPLPAISKLYCWYPNIEKSIHSFWRPRNSSWWGVEIKREIENLDWRNQSL